MTYGDMMNVMFKKEPCIKKLDAMHNNNTPTYQKISQIPKNNKKAEVNNVSHKLQISPKPR